MSELGSSMTPAKASEDTSRRKRKLWNFERPHLYWPWWIMFSMVVIVALAASYFMGMISTLSSAHSLLTSLHNQLNAVAQEKSHLNKEAQLLGVLQNVRTGHWSSPFAWVILAPQIIWLGVGLALGMIVAALFYRRRYKTVEPVSQASSSQNFSPPPPPVDSSPYSHSYAYGNSPEEKVRENSAHPRWLREFIGLVLWVIIVAGLAFVIVHVALTWGHNFPVHFSRLSRLF